MPRNSGNLLLLESMHSLNTSVLRLRQCALSCVPCTTPPVPVCVCLSLCLTCSPSSLLATTTQTLSISSGCALPCPPTLSGLGRKMARLQAELRSRACGSCQATQHPRHVVRIRLNVSPLFLSTGGSRCERCESDA